MLARQQIAKPAQEAVRARLCRYLSARMGRIISKRPPDFEVGDDPYDPYLSRWWLIPRNPILNIYLHVFWKDDDDRALHDHPFPSLSLLIGRLNSSYEPVDDDDVCLWEEYKDGDENKIRRIPRHSLTYRSASFAHRLIVPTPGVMTIFVTGPRIRQWGFWCGERWVHWKIFTGYAEGRKGSIGRGCD